MENIIGVRFRKNGKIYFFDSGRLHIKNDQYVIVETTQGIEIGKVVTINPQNKKTVSEISNIKKITRIASKEDIRRNELNKVKEKEAFKTCREKIRKHNLEMHLVDVEVKFDKSKIIFYFTAEGRIDFRDLVKDLALIYKTRIELRQIGVRDEVKKIGGNGVCGRELCCCSFLNNFDAVSIKMAKEQNIALNPCKIAGNCGRLMCCLKYEHEVYEEKLKKMPKIGSLVKTPEGNGTVENIEVLKEYVKVKLKDGEDIYYKSFSINDINIIKNAEQEKTKIENSDELKELQKLERLDKIENNIDFQNENNNYLEGGENDGI